MFRRRCLALRAIALVVPCCRFFLAESTLLSRRTPRGPAAPPRRARVFCYALVRTKPVDESLPGVARALDQACDGWALYGEEERQDPRIVRAYRATRAGEEFFDRNDTFLSVWSSHIAPLLHPRGLAKSVGAGYDFFVKVDSDTFVRPATFRHLFASYDPGRPLVLSVGRCGGPSDSEHAACTEGYFTAVSREAARRILLLERPEVCRLAAFGDRVGGGEWDSDDAELLSECFRDTGIRTEEPRDPEGRFLVPFPDYADCECLERISATEHAAALRSGTEVCGCDGCCLSPMLALFHHVKHGAEVARMHELFGGEPELELVN